jgi:hypothetical protein
MTLDTLRVVVASVKVGFYLDLATRVLVYICACRFEDSVLKDSNRIDQRHLQHQLCKNQPQSMISQLFFSN